MGSMADDNYELIAVDELLRRTARRLPDKVALIDGERRLTFVVDRSPNRHAQLEVLAAAAVLARAGARPAARRVVVLAVLEIEQVIGRMIEV